MPRAIVAILALVIISTGGVYAFQASLENAGEDITVANETWTPDAGNVTVLDESNRGGAYYSNETVVYGENGTLMDRGADYLWYPGNGTVEAVAGGGLDGDADAKISYEFQQTTAEQRELTALVSEIPRSVGLLFPVFLFVIFMAIVRG